MKKVYVLVMIHLLVFGTACYGAVSDDVYLRRDVFEAKMDAFMSEIRFMNEQLRGEIREVNAKIDTVEKNLNARIDSVEKNLNARIDSVEKNLNARIDSVEKNLNARIDGVEKHLNARIDGVDARVDDLRNDIYLGLVILGIVVSWPKLKEAAQKWGKSTPSITLEDVKRLIEENNARMSGKAQA